jgi:serine/threonine protein kinase
MQIGEGSFGRVYLAKWRETLVAVKLLLNTGVDVEDMEAAAELAISLSNPVLFNLQQVQARRGRPCRLLSALLAQPEARTSRHGLPCRGVWQQAVLGWYTPRRSRVDILRYPCPLFPLNLRRQP